MSKYYRVSAGEKFKDVCSECGLRQRELVEYNYLPTLNLLEDQVLMLPSDEDCPIKEFMNTMRRSHTHEFILFFHEGEIYILFLECNIKFKKIKYKKIEGCFIPHRAFCLRELLSQRDNIDYIAEANLKCNRGKGILLRSLLYGNSCSTETSSDVTECTTETIYKKIEGRTYTICQLQHNQYSQSDPIWR